MSVEIELVGSFSDEHGCVRAIRALRQTGVSQVRAFAPVPSEEITQATVSERSPVRLWVLIGGIVGVITGFAITIGTSLEWNLVVGGKPIVSIPPYIIIAFELMILLGGISAVLGFLYNSGIPSSISSSGYSSRFGDDRFGLVVRCDEPDGSRVESLLREAGAEEVVRGGA